MFESLEISFVFASKLFFFIFIVCFAALPIYVDLILTDGNEKKTKLFKISDRFKKKWKFE